MPDLYLGIKSFTGDYTVLATEQGLRSPRMVTMDLSFIQADSDAQKILEPGSIISKMSNGKGRVYPLAKTTSAITTASTAIPVSNARIFKDGGALVVMRPYARLDLALTWANGDTANIIISGQTITHTVANFSTLTQLAADIANTINNANTAKDRVLAIAENQYIHVFSKTGALYTIAIGADGTAGNGTITINGSVTTLQPDVVIGTISTGGINAATNTLTLASASAIRLPVGAPIGVASSMGDILGMVLSRTDLLQTSNDVACYTSASVYGARLPYWDSALQEALPEITLV